MFWRVAIAACLTLALAALAVQQPHAQFNGCAAGFCNPPVAAAGGGCSVAFTAGPAGQTGSISATFSAQSIGTASASRIVEVAVQANVNGTSLSDSVTIGGTTATQAVAERSNANQFGEIWYLALASGTTTNIVYTLSGTSPSIGSVQIAVYATTGCATNPSGGATVGTTAWGVVNPGTMSVTATVPTGGIGIGVFGTDRTLSPTWTNTVAGSACTSTCDFFQNNATTGNSIFSVHTATSGSQTPTSSSVATNYNAAMATWGP